MPINKKRQSGFSMIELLIALLILAIGLLGMASLMMSSVKSNQNAAMRSQAGWMAYDIVERIRLNAPEADNYLTDAADAAPNNPGCKNSGCTASDTAQLDLFEWKNQLAQMALNGAIENGPIANSYIVTLSWQDINTSEANTCPAGQCTFILRADL